MFSGLQKGIRVKQATVAQWDIRDCLGVRECLIALLKIINPVAETEKNKGD